MNPRIPSRAALAVAVQAVLVSAVSVSAFAQTPSEPPKQEPPKADAPKTTAPPAGQRPPGVRPGSAPSATPPKQTVDEVRVTSQRSANEDRRNSTASKIIITRDDIEQYGDSNLGEVMRRLPGVTTGGRPGRGGPPQMRGMGGGFTQILIDGERMPPGFSVDQITPEQVERIEILRAPTAETGTRAIAGTINIILREPLRARHNDIRGGLQWEQGKLSPNLSWTRNNSFSQTGTYNITTSLNMSEQKNASSTRTTTTNLQNNALELDQRAEGESLDKRHGIFASARFQWRLGPGEQFALAPFIVRSWTEGSLNGTLTQPTGSTPIPYARQAGNSEGKIAVTRLMANLNKRIDQDTRYELRANIGQFKLRNDSTVNQFAPSGARSLSQLIAADTVDNSYTLSGKLSRSVAEGKHAIVGGWEFERVKREDNTITRLNGVQQLAEFGDVLNIATTRKALYLQDEWDPSPRWSSYLGMRWEEIETRSDAPGNPVRNKSRVLNPLAQGVWRFDAPKRDQIRLGLTQSYRAPTTQNLVARPGLNTLYPIPGPNTATSTDRAGNPFLKPEIANGVDLAYENFLKSGGIVSVSLFTRHIKDLIRNVTALETVSWAPVQRYVTRPQNIGQAVTSGIEMDAKFQLTELIEGAPAINIRANMSVFHSNVSGIAKPNNRIDSQPTATGNLGGDYKFRGTPISVGGNMSFTPAYKLQQTPTQQSAIGVKRVLEAYMLYTVNSSAKVRFTVANFSARDSLNTSSIFVGNQVQSVFSDTPTHPSVSLRLEMRL